MSRNSLLETVEQFGQMSVRLRTKRLWVQISLLSLKYTNSLTVKNSNKDAEATDATLTSGDKLIHKMQSLLANPLGITAKYTIIKPDRYN